MSIYTVYTSKLFKEILQPFYPFADYGFISVINADKSIGAGKPIYANSKW